MNKDETGYGFDPSVFSSVWERVSGDAAPAVNGPYCRVPTDTDRLRGFMEDEAADIAAYRALARRTGGCESSALARICADEARHLSRLRSAYFILSGERFSPPPQCAPHREERVTDALRARYLAEINGAEEYAKAAESARRKDLSALFSELSADEARHARAVAELLGRCLG